MNGKDGNSASLKMTVYVHSSRLILSICLALFCLSDVPAQPSDSLFQYSLTIPVSAKLMTTDKLHNLYVITTTNELIKYTPDGLESFRYNDDTRGDLKIIDVTNPFNILLYYPDFLTITTLDRTLSKTGEYFLYDLELTDVQVVCLSNDNNVWIYDNTTFKLKKINSSGSMLVESDDLSMLLNVNPKPNFIRERNNWVYVNVPDSGILVFDNFGQYSHTIPLKGLEEFSILDDMMLYLCGKQVCSFHLTSLQQLQYPLPLLARGADRISYQYNKLFVAGQNKVDVFVLNKVVSN